MRDITTVNLADLVPDSIRDDPKVAAAVKAIDGELKAVSALCSLPALYSNIDTLDGKVLDHIAWQVDSKVWRDSWPINLKRSVIKTVILEKSKKGTRSAVQKAVQSLGSAVVIREWWETTPPGTPHTFDIVVTLAEIEGQVTAQTQKDLQIRIDDTKPARTHYTLSLAISANGNMYLGGAARTAIYARVNGNEQ